MIPEKKVTETSDKGLTGIKACAEGSGALPPCAPLSVPFVADQASGAAQYDKMQALSNGTLFPGLNLPFFRAVEARSVAENARSELMALQFVMWELGLYLDTHPDDAEAFALFRKYGELAREGQQKYVELFGPIMKRDTASKESFEWLNSPWPWEVVERSGR